MNIEITPITAISNLEKPTSAQIELGGSMARRRLATEVRKAMSLAGMSQSDMAAILGVNKSTISRMLSNPRNLTIESAGKLLRATGRFAVIGSEEIPTSANTLVVEPRTRTGYLEISSNQPHNIWKLTFERSHARTNTHSIAPYIPAAIVTSNPSATITEQKRQTTIHNQLSTRTIQSKIENIK